MPRDISSPTIEIEADSDTLIPDGEKPDDLEREIEDAIESIGSSNDELAMSNENEEVIGERDVSYIPNSAFDTASDAFDAPLAHKEASSPSINERREVIIAALQAKLGIEHWSRRHIDVFIAAEAMFIRDELIEDDKMLREVLQLTLFSMDPKKYSPSDQSVMRRKPDALHRALISEFKKRGKHDIAAKLEKYRTHLSGQHKAVKT